MVLSLLRTRGLYRGAKVTRIQRAFASVVDLPEEADCVVIGGGSVGCNVAMHMQMKGLKTVLLERHTLTAGTTWHTAGMLWRLRPSDTAIEVQAYTRSMCKQLEEEFGVQSWVENGGLFIAKNKERLDEYKRLSNIGQYWGIDSHVLSPKEVLDVYPILNVDDVYGAIYSPGDGTIDPAGVCQAYSKKARSLGAIVAEGVGVSSIEVEEGSSFGRNTRTIRAVQTACGRRIKTKFVVNSAGAWSNEVARMCQVEIPLRAIKHAYIVTEKMEGVHPGLPNMRDHDLSIYFKTQGDSLALGGYEQNPEFTPPENGAGGGVYMDPAFEFGLYDLDYDTFGQNLDGHIKRCPLIEETGIKSTVCGPESFTPDHQALIGPDVDVRGLIHACGFNSMGMMMAGLGREVANWAVEGCPTLDVFSYDVARFHPSTVRNDRWVEDRTHESYAKTYSIVFPHDEPLAGRGVRKSPFYDVLSSRGCVWQARQAFERPGWFVPEKGAAMLPMDYDFYGAYHDFGHQNGVITGLGRETIPKHPEHPYLQAIEEQLTFDWPKAFDRVKVECHAARNGVVFLDHSYFGKYILDGPGAGEAVDYLFTARITDRPEEDVIYTAMCNLRGGCEADLTISKLGSTPNGPYYICTGGASSTHNWRHMNEIIEAKGFKATLHDKSDDAGILSVQGPWSQRIVEQALGLDFSSAPIEFSKMRRVEFRGAPVTILRLTFVGELGYELHVAKEVAEECYMAVRSAAEDLQKTHGFPVEDGGYMCIDSLSAEKGFRHWHADLSNADTPAEAGIGFVALARLKAGETFLGSEALSKQRAEGLGRRLVCLSLPKEAGAMHGGETIWRDGNCVGYVKSTAFGHTVGRTISYGYVKGPQGVKITNKWLSEGSYQMGDKGRLIDAELHLKALVDPTSERVKGNY